LRTAIRSIAESRVWEVKELEVLADHVHLFIAAPSTESLVRIAKALKGISARVFFAEHPILRTMSRQGHLWGASYDIGTMGHLSAESMARYIRDLKLRRVGRPASSPK
jgi:putative transposase